MTEIQGWLIIAWLFVLQITLEKILRRLPND
jgi:hypothetical protein